MTGQTALTDSMRYLPLLFVAVHTALVGIMTAIVGFFGGEAVVLWNLFMLLDFPTSVILSRPFSNLENWSQAHLGTGLTYSVVFGACFAFAGGVQYYFIGVLLRRLRCQYPS
jgi:hypothetical protein